MKSNSPESLSDKLIIYDSNCKVCTAMKNLLVKLAPYIKDQVTAYKDLDLALISKVDPDRFRNEMALIDKGETRTKYGAEGIVFIFGSKLKIFKWLFSSRVFIALFTFFYKTIASNRYIIALPRSSFQCDCYPDKITKYRLSYIIITILIAVILTVLFGMSLKAYFPDRPYSMAAVEMLLIAGTGWVLQISLALTILKKNALDYIGHLGSIMVAGLLVLVPSILIHFIFKSDLYLIPALSVAMSSKLMLYIHIQRVKALNLHAAWNLSWFLFLQLTAVFWIYIFHFNY